MNLPARLLALATILVSLSFTAHADTYRFYVNNFDGYGSSLTFELPSSVPSVRIDGLDNQVIQHPVVDFIFQPGAFIPAPFRDVNAPLIVQNTTYEQLGEPLGVGFDDHQGADILVGLPYYGLEDLLAEGLIAQEYNLPTALFTEEDGVTEHTGIATFKLGTFGNVEIVNATPEPSTLCLFGTGIVGLVGVARRRLSS